MSGALEKLTDADLDFFRTERKVKVSGSHAKAKDIFVEQQFELVAAVDPSRLYRLYRRHHPLISGVFSVGLSVCVGSEWLTVCRYNGDYHAHRNKIEKDRLVGVFHIHHATERYIHAGLHPDGFAVQTDRYSNVETALRCMILDCSISGVLPDGDADPNSLDLFDEQAQND